MTPLQHFATAFFEGWGCLVELVVTVFFWARTNRCTGKLIVGLHVILYLFLLCVWLGSKA